MGTIQDFSFILPTRIEYGEHAIQRVGDELTRLQAKKIVVVTDQVVLGLPFFKTIESILSSWNGDWEIYDQVEANPKDYNVDQGAAMTAEYGADAILAIGGGSPIDCAKAMSVVATHGKSVHDYRDPKNITKDVLPIISVPTTAGTGSEVTFSSVITDTSTHIKFTVKHPRIAPVAAVLDPQVTVSMPKELTAATGMDALTHAIEAYTARNAEPISDACALHAVTYLCTHIRSAFSDGNDIAARSNMLMGSLLAGIAFSHSDVASVHCIAESLGGTFDLPHGVCNAVMLPEVVAYNLEYCRQRYADIARAAGVIETPDETMADRLVRYLRDLARELGLPRLNDFGVKEADFEDIAEASFQNGSNGSNPRPMSKEDYLKILERMR